MAFELDPGESIPDAVRTTAEEQLRKILEALTGTAGLGRDEATHDARKRTKKLRALLRLVRSELGDEVYRRENQALRDAARRLSAVRDAAVLIAALDDLVTPAEGPLSPTAVAGLRAVLAAEHRALQGDRGREDTLGAAAEDYERVLVRVEHWPLADRGWGSLQPGLEAVAGDGRRYMDRARTKGRVEDFHEWRKQVKYLRHQFELLRPAWPAVLEAMAGTAAEVGELLGVDHDLAVLGDRVLHEGGLGPDTEAALVARIDERRAACQQKAFALGRRLYGEKPAALAERLGRLWKTAA